jgi:hypothetical protein
MRAKAHFQPRARGLEIRKWNRKTGKAREKDRGKSKTHPYKKPNRKGRTLPIDGTDKDWPTRQRERRPALIAYFTDGFAFEASSSPFIRSISDCRE